MKEFPTLESEKSAPRVENIEIQITEEKKKCKLPTIKANNSFNYGEIYQF